MKLKKEIFNYIECSTKWTIEDKELDISFPIYIKATYDLWNTSVAGFGVLFARIKDKKTSMTIHYNAIKKIEDMYPCRVVLVFDELDSRSVNRLINKFIPFIVKNKQIYMPFAFMQLQTNNKPIGLKKLKDLTPDADTILIGYLDNKIINDMRIKDIATHINREVRATSTALFVLESLEYVNIQKIGREKRVSFEDKQDIYEKLKQVGNSPIKYTFYSNSELLFGESIYSGYSAIEKFSMLIDNSIPTIAISEKKLSKIEITDITCEKENAIYNVEVWNRDPSIFSIDGVINPLYIIRLLKDEDDERTEYAIEEIENKIIDKFKGK